MKIRYYLRGLGLGILFTAIFFLVSNNAASQTMSDEEIKARAKELGMTESTVLAELAVSETEENEPVTEIEESEPVVETEENEPVVETEENEPVAETEESESVPEENTVETITEENEEIDRKKPESAEPVKLVVNRGEGSDTVSRRLAEMGLVSDANEYDKYLMTNGYDKRIGAGEHTIPAGATWEEIAKIICNMM